MRSHHRAVSARFILARNNKSTKVSRSLEVLLIVWLHIGNLPLSNLQSIPHSKVLQTLGCQSPLLDVSTRRADGVIIYAPKCLIGRLEKRVPALPQHAFLLVQAIVSRWQSPPSLHNDGGVFHVTNPLQGSWGDRNVLLNRSP